jgi:hypothetical protein
MTTYIFTGKLAIRNDIGITSKKPARPRPPLISLAELATLMGITPQKLVSELGTQRKAGVIPLEPALRSKSNGTTSTYYHKNEAIQYAKKIGYLGVKGGTK